MKVASKHNNSNAVAPKLDIVERERKNTSMLTMGNFH